MAESMYYAPIWRRMGARHEFNSGQITLELRRKLETFKVVTANSYAAELAHQPLTPDCVFEP